MGNVLPGKKTYILIALAALAAALNYIHGLIDHGFNVNEFIGFLNTEALTAALGTIRLAIAKK